ncbi:cytochrome P450 [Ramicandelaber brevisporus]|nr:cytochrome P450 [Ramicandelaber brevisporus]
MTLVGSLIIYLAVASVLHFVFRQLYSVFHIPPSLQHLPRLSPLTILLSLFRRGPLSFSRIYLSTRSSLVNSSGLYLFWIGGWRLTVADVEIARQIYANVDMFPKVKLTAEVPGTLLSKIFADSMIFSNGDNWKRQRKAFNPAFVKKFETTTFGMLARQLFERIDHDSTTGDINSNSNDSNDSNDSGSSNDSGGERKALDATVLMQRTILDILGEAVFGFRFNAVREPTNPWIRAYKAIFKDALSQLYYVFPMLDKRWNPYRRNIFESFDEFEALIDRAIAERKATAAAATATPIPTPRPTGGVSAAKDEAKVVRDDLLQRLINASSDPDNPSLQPHEFHGNLLMLFLGGHDTTASAIACALYYLSVNPHLQNRLYNDISATLGPLDPATFSTYEDAIPTNAQLASIPLLTAFVRETLRMVPLVSLLPYRAPTTDVLLTESRLTIPQGTYITVFIYGIQHSAKYWCNPETFDPDRHIEGTASFAADEAVRAETGTKDPLVWQAFGAGPRSCIGQHFAMLVQKLVLAMLLRRYRVKLQPGSLHDDGIFINVTALTTVAPVPIIFEPRV